MNARTGWRVRHSINLHKALVIPVVLFLMWRTGEWGMTAFVYLALHGSYGLLWLVKDALFRDRRFDEEIPLIGGVFLFASLASYYAPAVLITTRHVAAAPWLTSVAISLVILGVFSHYVADAQKHVLLSEQRRRLVTGGLFSRTRNPNYLGEMMIYAGFALLARHWLPWVVLGLWWCFFFRNMFAKDRSLSRYPEFAAYRKGSWLVLPKPGRPYDAILERSGSAGSTGTPST